MAFHDWLMLAGAFLVVAAATRSLLRRLALTMAMLYLGIGFALGPSGAGLSALIPLQRTEVIERVAEIAVIVSLFTAGLKMGHPSRRGYWRAPLRLAVGSMVLTVALIAVLGVWLLGLPLGAAVLLGAILAPTDPVLASDIGLTGPNERDRLKIALSGEAGLNDGTAFPFVMLGLGLLGLHDLGAFGWRWVAVDLLWATFSGLGIGVLLGYLTGHFIIHLRLTREAEIELDEFLALGLIALAYGLAVAMHGYGFLAVFAAGVGLRRSEYAHARLPANHVADASDGVAASHATRLTDASPAHATREVLRFNEQAEHIGEFVVVLLVGAMLAPSYFSPTVVLFIALLFVLVRPLSVSLALVGSTTSLSQRGIAAWSGIRGVGSLYYVTYAAGQGLSAELAGKLMAVTLAVIAASIFVHGFTAPWLMKRYLRARPRRRQER